MNYRNKNKPNCQNRKGILLLVVLSMLTLFLMIGTAYIVSASHYRKMNKTMAQAAEASYLEVDQTALLDQALFQLVRDTRNKYSAIRYHSLLRDMYGNDSIKIGPSQVGPGGSGITFLRRDPGNFLLQTKNGDNLTINDNSNGNFGLDMNMPQRGDQLFWVGVSFPFSPATGFQPSLSLLDNYYNGRLLSFTDGELQGTTARIVRYEVYEDTSITDKRFAIFTLLMLSGDKIIRSQELTFDAATDYTRWERTSAVINGMPFNGTGVGHKLAATTGARLNAMESVLDNTGSAIDRPIGLMPNSTFFNSLNVTTANYFQTAQLQWVGYGGSDESYDTADFQNMALALMQAGQDESVPFGSTSLATMVLPSFHRPALLNYWKQQLTAGEYPLESESNLLRKILLRPNWLDHPNFTGSNPEFAAAVDNSEKLNRMIYGPWDVDNDNDGIRDGIWTDIGASLMAGPAGRLARVEIILLGGAGSFWSR